MDTYETFLLPGHANVEEFHVFWGPISPEHEPKKPPNYLAVHL